MTISLTFQKYWGQKELLLIYRKKTKQSKQNKQINKKWASNIFRFLKSYIEH